MVSSCSPRSRLGSPEGCSLAGEPFVLKHTVRCQNTDVHTRHKGNVLIAIGFDCIIVRCRDGGCRRWNKIRFKFPGLKFDLRNAAITQELLPENFHIDMTDAATVVSERSK